MEPEDEESKTTRIAEEQKEAEELMRNLEHEEVRWRSRKTRELELATVKRRRKPSEDDDRGSKVGASRPKKLKFTPIMEDWEEEDEYTDGEQGAEDSGDDQDQTSTDVVGGSRLVASTTSKPTLITDYYTMIKPGSLEPIVWDDEDGEGWWVEQTNQFQDLHYKRPGGDVNQPSSTVPAVEMVEKSPPTTGVKPSLGV